MMEQFYDVFISYGRKHSKEFATRLHDDLAQKGLRVWFDQNDIPLGVDFQHQIDDGILRATVFCFIISPHSVRSEYCQKEIVLAKKLKKRIVPLLHVEPKDEWELLDELIAKLNWIYFRDAEDDYNNSFNGLVSLINDEKLYVQQHTELLVQALAWEKANKNGSFLLVGAERQDAEDWLLRRFSGKQAPVVPTELHALYITESKKNANNLQTDVFVSYDREDMVWRDWVRTKLAFENITCWTDTGDIKTGSHFEEAIREGIEQSDNFVYLITPASLQSEYCRMELSYAIELNKRVIPIMVAPTPDTSLPDSLRSLQYISVTSENAVDEPAETVGRLLSKINEEYDYYHKAKLFLVLALKWKKQHENKSILLRGYNLEQASTWMKLGMQRSVHPPLPLHSEFIELSAAQTVDLTTEVFISYSRKDSDFARQLNDRIQMSGKTTWFDQESIAAGTDFAAEIYKGIESSDNFLFVISPGSVESPYCADEVEYAYKQGKRFVTVLYKAVEPDTLHPSLASVQWIDFSQRSKFDIAFSELIRTLDTDREHVQAHTKWQNTALEWKAKNETSDLLLRGSAFSVAELWLDTAIKEHKSPLPTKAQKEFIEASRKSILLAERRRKRNNLIVRLLLVLSLIGLAGAVYLGYEAWKSSIKAKEQAEIATRNEELANIEKTKALEAEKLAKEQKELADKEKIKAQQEREKADSERKRAEQKEREARLAQAEALTQKQRAETSLTAAQLAKAKEEEANKRAKYHLYIFNGKEMANKSLLMEQNDNLQALLAKESYVLTKYGSLDFGLHTVNYDPEILEALQKALLTKEDNLLRASSILTLAGGTTVFLFADKRNHLSWGSVDLKQSPIKLRLHKETSVPSPIIRCMAVDIVNMYGACGTMDGNVYLADTGFVFKPLYHHSGGVLDLKFIHQEKTLISGGNDSRMVIYDLAKQQVTRSVLAAAAIRTIACGQNSVYACDVDGHLWKTAKLSSDTILQTFGKSNNKYYTIAYAKTRKWLVAGTNDGRVFILDANGNEQLLTRSHNGID